MKKAALFIVASAILFSCAKPEELVSVRFNLGVESGPITRAMPDGLSDALDATLPSGPFSLKAQSTDNDLRSYSVTTGVPITMAVGGYSVTGSGVGSSISEITNGTLYSSPTWSLSSEVTVTQNTTDFSLSASYTCPAFVFDLSEVDYVEFANGANIVKITSFPGTEDFGVVYPKNGSTSWISSKSLWLYVYPVDKVNGETALYKIISPSSSASGDFTQVRNGYWYKFSPGKVDVVSGSINMGFNEWQEGN